MLVSPDATPRGALAAFHPREMKGGGEEINKIKQKNRGERTDVCHSLSRNEPLEPAGSHCARDSMRERLLKIPSQASLRCVCFTAGEKLWQLCHCVILVK